MLLWFAALLAVAKARPASHRFALRPESFSPPPGAAPQCNSTINCGFPGITPQECILAGCCFDDQSSGPWCQGAACTSDSFCLNGGTCLSNGSCACASGFTGYKCLDAVITTVHVVQACHLDVGFAETAVDIVNLYFDHHIPMAIQVAQELVALGGEARLQFMFQSYVLSLYTNCPPNMGLNCPNQSSLAAFNEAVHNGSVTYHAFPFNSEQELYNSISMLEAGIQVTHLMDDEYNLARKKTLSQRDVPGITRSIIPILLKNNVTAISVGVNSASTPPFVPNVFNWYDPQSGETILAMWHPGGYGGITVADAVFVPGLSHALVFDWNGDNAGPYTAAEYIAHFVQIGLEFPGAQVVSSTFDNFTRLITEEYQSQLPTYNNEIGDTWIYGVPSDPKKSAILRAMNRAWAQYNEEGGEQDAVYLNASRLAIKNGEHTWGLDVKSYLFDNSNYSNQYFETARVSGPFASQYWTMEQSWWEQREWGIDIPIATLQAAHHPLYTIVEDEITQLTAWIPDPNAEGYNQVLDFNAIFIFGQYEIGFDAITGKIITFNVNNVEYASETNPMGQFLYRMYDQADVDLFLAEYLFEQPPPSWAYHDFGKPNCTQSPHASFFTTLTTLWVSQNESQASIYAQYTFNNDSSILYGTPETAWLQIILPLDISLPVKYNVLFINKTTTRMPEAMFFTFNPINSASATWEMHKLGEWIQPQEVVVGGSPHLHAIDQGVRANFTNGHSLTVTIFDAPVVNMGLPNAYPIPTNVTTDMSYGFSSLAWDNLWGTNYVMWWPYNYNYKPVAGEENLLLRYELAFV